MLTWPLEIADGRAAGPNAPTAGPSPYAVFRLGRPPCSARRGAIGMEQFEPDELPRPTRWDVGDATE